MSDPTLKQIYAKAIGDLAIDYMEAKYGEFGYPLAESKAAKLISDIKTILDDEALDDPQCFQRIDAIVDMFHAAGLNVTRHDWG